jgi:hypothetical protein
MYVEQRSRTTIDDRITYTTITTATTTTKVSTSNILSHFIVFFVLCPRVFGG